MVLSLTARSGFLQIRCLIVKDKNYNTFLRVCKYFDGIFEHEDIVKIRGFLKSVNRNFTDTRSGAKFVAKELLNFIEKERLSLDYEPLYKYVSAESNSTAFESDYSYFTKKIKINGNSTSATEKELAEVIDRERDRGFSLLKKTIRRKDSDKGSFIEYTAEFRRHEIDRTDVKKNYLKIDHTASGVEKYLIISDLHIPYHNESLLNSVVSMAEKEGIKNLIINGDLVDLAFMSSFEKTSTQLSQDYIENSLEKTQEIINLLSEKFEKKYFLEGNHDERMRRNTLGEKIKAFIPSMHPDSRMKNVPYNSVSGLFLMPIRGFKCLLYGESLWIGDYRIHHGQETGNMKVDDHYNTLIGHTHRAEEKFLSTREGIIRKIRTGCLVDLSSDIPAATYDSSLKWTNGFAVLTLLEDDTCFIENVVCDTNKFIYRDKVWPF